MDLISKEKAAENQHKKVRGRPWPKGVSGNPGGLPGRPRTRWISEIYEEILTDPETRADVKRQIIQTMCSKGMAGVLERREAAERTEGKVTQVVDMEVSGKLTLEQVLEARKKAGK